MGLNITQEIKEKVTAITATPWDTCIKYLGIKLSDLNLKPIMNSAKTHFEQRAESASSMLGMGGSFEDENSSKIDFCVSELTFHNTAGYAE